MRHSVSFGELNQGVRPVLPSGDKIDANWRRSALREARKRLIRAAEMVPLAWDELMGSEDEEPAEDDGASMDLVTEAITELRSALEALQRLERKTSR